ncbi:MAG TPA: polymer-forming cytoskeletal protein [Pyrinomonadaceae bacterium]|nr:polymer-forming cytoskeletal protein [Pyrinomonadaceae bacterium]
MGRNPKDDKSDTTADHTPQTPASASYGSAGSSAGSTAASGASGSGAAAGSVSDNYYQAATNTPTTSRAVTESESLARDIKEGTLTGFVGNGTTLTGEANFKGMLRVDGHLSGRVNSQDGTLIVSTNGQVDANVEVSIAQIYGTVNGDIVATKRIEMGRTARVTGNIQTPTLAIEQGALFEGGCRMMQIKEQQDGKRGGRDDAATPGSVIRESGGDSGVADLTDTASAS